MLGIRILLYFVVTFDAYFIVDAASQLSIINGRSKYKVGKGSDLGTEGLLLENMGVKSFDNETRKFEDLLYESMQEGKITDVDGFANVVKEAITTGVSVVPVIGSVFPIVLACIDMLTQKNDWQAALAATIMDTVDQKTAETKATEIVQMLKAIHSSLTTANEANKETVYWDTRKDLDYMMNIFDDSKSIFKKYPLLGAPILINLAKMIVQLNREINTPYISCKMRNILTDYRMRTVDARLDKIKLKIHEKSGGPYPAYVYRVYRFDEITTKAHAMTEPYTKNTFDKSSRMSCKQIKLDDNLLRLERWSNLIRVDESVELDDEFGSYFEFPLNIYCVLEYYRYVRHRIEEIFDITESFNDLCDPKDAPKPTGRGYFSIIIKRVWVPSSKSITVNVYIENDKVGTSEKKDGGPVYGVCNIFSQIYTSGLVNKHETITAVVLGDSSINTIDSDKPYVKANLTDGTVNEHMTYALKYGQPFHEAFLLLEAVVFWQDEYETSPIADMFLSEKEQKNNVMSRYLKSVAQKQLILKNVDTNNVTNVFEKINMFRMNSFG